MGEASAVPPTIVGISLIVGCLLLLYIWGGAETSEGYSSKRKRKLSPPRGSSVWQPCDSKGCKKETGVPRKNCMKCLGVGYVEAGAMGLHLPVRIPAPSQDLVEGTYHWSNKTKTVSDGPKTTYLHEYLVFQGGLGGGEKALSGRLWVCTKCGETSDAIVPTVTGCEEPPPDEEEEPSPLTVAYREGKVEDPTDEVDEL